MSMDNEALIVKNSGVGYEVFDRNISSGHKDFKRAFPLNSGLEPALIYAGNMRTAYGIRYEIPREATTITPNPGAWVGAHGETLEWFCDACKEPGITRRAKYCHGCGLLIKRD